MYRNLSKVNLPKKNKPKALTKALSKTSNEVEEVKILHNRNLQLNIELKKSQQREIEKTINRIDALIHPETKQSIKRIPRIITKKAVTISSPRTVNTSS
jgi:hypothetical protein